MNQLFCKPCWDRGHSCPAHEFVGGEPWCIFCIDEVECPNAKKNAPKFNQEFVEQRLKEHRENLSLEKQEETIVEKTCKTCGKKLIERNQSGYCTKHFYDSKRKSARDDQPTVTPFQRAMRKANRQSDSGLTLNEAQIDRFFSLLPAEKKFELVSTFLSLE